MIPTLYESFRHWLEGGSVNILSIEQIKEFFELEIELYSK